MCLVELILVVASRDTYPSLPHSFWTKNTWPQPELSTSDSLELLWEQGPACAQGRYCSRLWDLHGSHGQGHGFAASMVTSS